MSDIRESEAEFWSAWRMRWLPRLAVVAAITPLLAMSECIGQSAYEAKLANDGTIHLNKAYFVCTNYDSGRACDQWSGKWTAPHTYPAIKVEP